MVSLRVLRVQRRARQSLEQRVLERTRDLADANATLTRASRAKTEFLANTSHEIRTPLAAILGFADLLDRERLETNDRREIARIIRRNGEHLLAIVNDILDITKIEAGKLTVEAIACSPQQIAQEVCALLRNRAQSKGLALSLQIEGPELPRWIESDPTRIRQILLNLVGNAIKFTERGGVTDGAVAGCARREPRLRVEVRDTGIGMTPEEAARVFADFEQADSSTTRRFGGSGLGLAICRRLTAVLGGELSVQSTRGQGSTFVLVLPVARAVDPVDDLRETAIIAPRGIPPRSGLHVLVADDSADIQMLVTRFLADIAAAATVVSNGREAVEAALAALHQGRPFDLILMDLHMPELDGAEAARTLRNAGLEQPIVALTASDDIGDRERCAAAGYSDFLVKPIDRVQLIQKIATLNGVDPGEPRRGAGERRARARRRCTAGDRGAGASLRCGAPAGDGRRRCVGARRAAGAVPGRRARAGAIDPDRGVGRRRRCAARRRAQAEGHAAHGLGGARRRRCGGAGERGARGRPAALRSAGRRAAGRRSRGSARRWMAARRGRRAGPPHPHPLLRADVEERDFGMGHRARDFGIRH